MARGCLSFASFRVTPTRVRTCADSVPGTVPKAMQYLFCRSHGLKLAVAHFGSSESVPGPHDGAHFEKSPTFEEELSAEVHSRTWNGAECADTAHVEDRVPEVCAVPHRLCTIRRSGPTISMHRPPVSHATIL